MIPCSFCFELSSCVIACDEICLTRRARLYRLPTSIYPISSCICHTHTHGYRIRICICIVHGSEHFYLCFYFPSASLVAVAAAPFPLLLFCLCLHLCLWLYQNPFLFVRVVSLRKRKMRTFFPFFIRVLLTFRSRQQQQAGEWVGRAGQGGIRVGLTIQNTRQM